MKQVNVHVPQAGDEELATCLDGLRSFGNARFARPTDPNDSVPANQYRLVREDVARH